MQTGSRDLEVQARNQALQLERIEQQMGRLRVVHENSIEESRKLFAEIRSLRRWMIAMAILYSRASAGLGRAGYVPGDPFASAFISLWALFLSC